MSCRFEMNVTDTVLTNLNPPSSTQNEGVCMVGSLEAKPSKKGLKKRNSTKPAKTPKTPDIPLDFAAKVLLNYIELTLPIRTISEANCFEPWQKKHKRHKSQKKIVFFSILEYKYLIKLPCVITFIRYAPKALDKHDNLPISMKWICDALCAEITGEHRPGLADNFEGLTIKYDQVKSKQYAVKIIITF